MKLNRYICVTLLLVAGLLLIGCGKKYKANLDKQYASYWKYSLGDYQVSYENKYLSYDSDMKQDKYRQYTFTFKDSENKERNFYIDNYYANGDDFEKKLTSGIAGYLCEEVDTQRIKDILNESDFKATYIHKNCYVEPVDKSIKFSDDENGVKISKLNYKTLGENNVNLLISINVSTEEDYLFEQFIQDMVPYLEEVTTCDRGVNDNDLDNMKIELIMNSRQSGKHTVRLIRKGLGYTPVED